MSGPLRLCLALALLFLAPLAHARLVTWQLHDVRFSDGTLATGFIVIDTAVHCDSCSDAIRDWKIMMINSDQSVPMWGMFNGYGPWPNSNARYSEHDGKSAFTFATAPWGDAYVQLDLQMQSLLPADGGAVAVDTAGSQEALYFDIRPTGPPPFYLRTVIGGDFTARAIPEASIAAWWTIAIMCVVPLLRAAQPAQSRYAARRSR